MMEEAPGSPNKAGMEKRDAASKAVSVVPAAESRGGRWPFYVVVTVVVAMVMGVFMFVDLRPLIAVDMWQAALPKDEIIGKWFRDRESGAFGVQIVDRDAGDANVRVRYRMRNEAGDFTTSERIFHFGERNNLLGVEKVTFNEEAEPSRASLPEGDMPPSGAAATGAEPVQPLVQKALPVSTRTAKAKSSKANKAVVEETPVSGPTDAEQPRAAGDYFPWGVRANNKPAAVAAKPVSGSTPEAVPATALQAEAPAQELSATGDYFPWGERAKNRPAAAAASASSPSEASSQVEASAGDYFPWGVRAKNKPSEGAESPH